MARYSSVLIDVLFWVAAFCLSPLILCYFLLAGLRASLLALLRLWKYPKPKLIPEPFDPDVENSLGNWNASETGSKSRTVGEVLEVKKMLSSMKFTELLVQDIQGKNVTKSSKPPGKIPIKLPPEIIDLILDLGEYWPCTKTSVSRVMLVGSPRPDSNTSVWMDKERDWKTNTPGASIKTKPWRRIPSAELGRNIDEENTDGETYNPHGVYLRSFPVGSEMRLVLPEDVEATHSAKNKKGSASDSEESRWQRLSKMLERGLWKSPVVSVVELKNIKPKPSSEGNCITSGPLSKGKAQHKPYIARSLSPSEADSWCLEIDELYPNIRPGIDEVAIQKRELRRDRRQWRSYYTKSHFRRRVIPIFENFVTIRKEKSLTENQVQSTTETPFERKSILIPRLVDCAGNLAGPGKPSEARKAAKVRKIVWTIWSKEMVDYAVDDRRPLNHDSTPDLTWFEMFIEEPVTVRKGDNDAEIVWKRKFPKSNENILVSRDLGHRIRANNSRVRVHRVVWDWDDWEDKTPDDDNEEEGNWRYLGADFMDMHHITNLPSHPYRHFNAKNYCNCPYGKKLYWGEGIPPSKSSPVSSRLISSPEQATSSKSSSTAPSTSSSGSSSSSSNSSSSASSSSSSSNSTSSTNSSTNTASGNPKSVANSPILPNTVLEERLRNGSLRKNGALGKLVKSLQMGDRLVLVVRAGGGLGWSPTIQRWDIGVFRAEVDIYWAV
ncbi:hypothetical protein BDZ91DRAFT_472184 [Kalaharituber pfeilii]|nr:hypothetical protein BDZ91DRAFT_472184 [Kalaharituber pfeilii]